MSEEKFSEKILIRTAVGFFTGILVGNLIAITPDLIDRIQPAWVTKSLLQRMGSFSGALVMQSLLSGLIGAVGITGMLLYGIESWPMFKAALFHYLLILAVFIPSALFLGWIELKLADVLIMSGSMAAAYAIIWLFMYLNYRRQTEEMNRKLRMKNEE